MKNIIYSLFFVLPLGIFAQSNMYITVDLDGGMLDASHQKLTPNISDAIVDDYQSHYNLKASLGFLMEFDNNLSATAGFSQSMRFWNLEGQKNGNTLKVTNRQNYASLFLGGYYQVPISKSGKINLYGGTKLSFDFINYSALSKKDGVERDYVDVYTKDSQTLGINIIPELGLKGYFNSGNFWKISCRYNLPLNGDIVDGTINHHLDNSIAESITYTSSGNYIAVGLTYGFNLN